MIANGAGMLVKTLCCASPFAGMRTSGTATICPAGSAWRGRLVATHPNGEMITNNPCLGAGIEYRYSVLFGNGPVQIGLRVGNESKRNNT